MSANHLLLLGFSTAHKLVGLEDGHDLIAVALALIVLLALADATGCALVWQTLWRWHLVGGGHWHLLVAVVVVVAGLVLLLLLAHDLAITLHAVLLLLHVVVATRLVLLLLPIISVVVESLLGVVSTILVHLLPHVVLARPFLLQLTHEQRQRCDQLNHVLVVAVHLASLLSVELLAVPLFFLPLLA